LAHCLVKPGGTVLAQPIVAFLFQLTVEQVANVRVRAEASIFWPIVGQRMSRSRRQTAALIPLETGAADW
jgi:hypothetical protein